MKFLKRFKLFLEQDEVEVKEVEGADDLVKDNDKTNQD